MSAQSAAFTEEKVQPLASPAAYALFYPALVEVARAHGYALTLHGSMKRDCDLVAIPWAEGASEPADLTFALKDTCGAVFTSREFDYLHKKPPFTEKPHGRIAISLHLTDHGMRGPYFDLSIMPRIANELLSQASTTCPPVCGEQQLVVAGTAGGSPAPGESV